MQRNFKGKRKIVRGFIGLFLALLICLLGVIGNFLGGSEALHIYCHQSHCQSCDFLKISQRIHGGFGDVVASANIARLGVSLDDLPLELSKWHLIFKNPVDLKVRMDS